VLDLANDDDPVYVEAMLRSIYGLDYEKNRDDEMNTSTVMADST